MRILNDSERKKEPIDEGKKYKIFLSYFEEELYKNKDELKNNINVEFKDDVIEQYIHNLNTLKCPRCGGYLRREYFEDLDQYIYHCSTDKGICNFKTTELEYRINLKACPKCDGYLLFKTTTANNKLMLGCSNYISEDINSCNYVEFIDIDK